MEKIVVGGVDLDAVEARLLDSVGGLAEGFHNGVDDFAAGFLGLAPFLSPPGAGRDQGEGVELRVGVGAGMEELGEDLRAVGVQAVGQGTVVSMVGVGRVIYFFNRISKARLQQLAGLAAAETTSTAT